MSFLDRIKGKAPRDGAEDSVPPVPFDELVAAGQPDGADGPPGRPAMPSQPRD